MLKDKVALITGGSRGIGKAIAEAYVKNGCNVIINYSNNEQKANETIEYLKSFNTKVLALKSDVSDYNEVKKMFNIINKEFGKLDILVNNAGIMKNSMIMMTTQENWNETINVNLTGTFNCLQLASKVMMKNKYGKIINISSIIGTNGNHGCVPYSSSKAGIIGMTKSAAKELGRFSINVNAIAPGIINTDLTDKENKDEIIKNISLGKIGEPEDVAKVALFLASDLSDYVNGQIIGVDGGMII